MTTKKNFPVKQEYIEIFLNLNKAMHEKTLAAQTSFLQQVKDLSALQIDIIQIISFHNPCTMSQIAKSANITLGNVTQIIDKLIALKYVKRVPAKSDRRIIFAVLTPKGKELIQKADDYVRVVAKQLMSVFSEDEQMMFLKFWQKILE